MIVKLLFFFLLALIVCTTVDFAFLQFLPSPAVSGYNTWVGVISAVAITLAIAMNWQAWAARLEAQGARRQWSAWRRSPLIMGMGSIVLGVVIIQLSLIRFVPHLIVLAAGEQGAREFTVKDLYDGRRCWKGLELEGLPFMIDRVCGIPEALHAQIKPGMKIVVRGRMNWAGIVPETVEIEPPKN